MLPPRRWPKAKSGPHTRWRAPRPSCSTRCTKASAVIRLKVVVERQFIDDPHPERRQRVVAGRRQGEAERRVVGAEQLARMRLEGQHGERRFRPALGARPAAHGRARDGRRRNCQAPPPRRGRPRAGRASGGRCASAAVRRQGGRRTGGKGRVHAGLHTGPTSIEEDGHPVLRASPAFRAAEIWRRGMVVAPRHAEVGCHAEVGRHAGVGVRPSRAGPAAAGRAESRPPPRG